MVRIGDLNNLATASAEDEIPIVDVSTDTTFKCIAAEISGAIKITPVTQNCVTPVASGLGSLAAGNGAQALANRVIALGTDTIGDAFSDYAIILGDDAYSTFSQYSVLVGKNQTLENSFGGISVGYNGNMYGGYNSIGIGSYTYIGTSYSGYESAGAVVIGNRASSVSFAANINNTVALGSYTDVSASRAMALGAYAESVANSAVQIGFGTNSTTETLQFLDNTIANSNSIQAATQNTGSTPISTPADGTIIVDTSTPALYFRANGAWETAGGGGGGGSATNYIITTEFSPSAGIIPPTAVTNQSLAAGSGAEATGIRGTAIGAEAIANFSNTTVVGANAEGKASYSVTIGTNTDNTASRSVLIGERSVLDTNSDDTVAIGQNLDIINSANAITLNGYLLNSDRSLVAGNSSILNSNAAIALGDQIVVNQSADAINIGGFSEATNAVRSVAVGFNTSVTATEGIALGAGGVVTAASAAQIGQGTNNTAGTLQFQTKTIANGTSIQATTQSTGAAPLSTPADGTLIVDTSTPALYFRANGAWETAGGGGGNPYLDINSSDSATASAPGTNSLAAGSGASAPGEGNIAIGRNSSVTSSIRNTVLGSYASAATGSSVVVGAFGSATATRAISIGANALGGGADSVALGGGVNSAFAARTAASYTVQLLNGENSTTGTLQFRDITVCNSESIQATTQNTGVAPTTSPADGTIIVDEAGTGTLWVRVAGVWRSTALA